MINELIFCFSIVFIAAATIGALTVSAAALTALVSLSVVLMNLFVTKQILLFGYNATSTDALGIGAVLGINLLREYYGRAVGRQAVIISFLAVGFYTIISALVLAYEPSAWDTQHVHCVALLQPMPRILIASLISYITIETLEYWLYDRLYKKLNGRYFIARNYAIVLFTQLLDTVFFTLLGLHGIVDNIGEIMLVSYGIKVVTIICMTPLVALCKKILDWVGYVAV